ncbi:DUF106 domain-containing protein [Candidatus Bathyarchaeota archaeon]|nr:DUF106 domain-containing protein [Candidatus Bathyarchaeota archaeon]
MVVRNTWRLCRLLPEILKVLPFSTIFILSIAAAISLLTSLANRLLGDPRKTKAWRKEVSEWNAELREAQKQRDNKRMEKLMKKQQYILQLQSKMMWQSMKVMLLFFVPLILMWQFLGGFYQNTPIAFFPGISDSSGVITIPLIGMNFQSLIWWYLLSSFLFGTIFSHLLGLVAVE